MQATSSTHLNSSETAVWFASEGSKVEGVGACNGTSDIELMGTAPSERIASGGCSCVDVQGANGSGSGLAGSSFGGATGAETEASCGSRVDRGVALVASVGAAVGVGVTGRTGCCATSAG